MTNLTLTVDEDILRAARIKALELGTSVNTLQRGAPGPRSTRDCEAPRAGPDASASYRRT
jgi:hypothetical protein